MRQRVARLLKKVGRFGKVELKGYRESDCGSLAGLIVDIVSSMLFTENSLYAIEMREDYIASFNWKKFSETIQAKTENAATGNLPKAFYNPWQANISAVKQGIAYRNFSAGLLNQVNCFSVALENNKALSSYIPENQIIHNYSQFSLEKNEENYFSVNNQYQGPSL